MEVGPLLCDIIHFWHMNIEETMRRLAGRSLAAVMLLLCGCVRTTVPRAAIPPEVFRLAATNRRPLHLMLPGNTEELSAGHQYLLFFIPFGRVVIEHPEEHLRSAAYRGLSLNGYNPLVDAAAAGNIPSMQFSLTGVQVSAYDFLITRKIVCDIQVEVRRYSAQGELERVAEGRVAETDFVRYAFAPELQTVFLKAMDGAVEQALLQLF